MKKPILCFLIPIFLISFLISFVSAWSYDNSERYGDAYAYVEVVGMYPECEGNAHGSYCAGTWYADVSHTGDKFYIAYKVSSWPSADDNGYSGQGVQLTQDGRKYLDESGNVPRYILCAWDYDSSPNGDWAWAGRCGGYLGTGYLDGKKNVDCYDNSDCSSGQICDKSGDWETWECKVNLCEYVSCEDKCEYATRYYDGVCSEGVCQYQTENCFYGCDGKLCAEGDEEEVCCKYYASGGAEYQWTTTSECKTPEEVIVDDSYCEDEELTLFDRFINWIKETWKKIFG